MNSEEPPEVKVCSIDDELAEVVTKDEQRELRLNVAESKANRKSVLAEIVADNALRRFHRIMSRWLCDSNPFANGFLGLPPLIEGIPSKSPAFGETFSVPQPSTAQQTSWQELREAARTSPVIQAFLTQWQVGGFVSLESCLMARIIEQTNTIEQLKQAILKDRQERPGPVVESGFL